MSDEIPARNLLEHVPGKERLPKPEGSCSIPPWDSTRTAQPQEAPAHLQLPDLQEVAPYEPMTATQVGFDGEANIFTPARGFSDLASQRLTIRFLRGKTKHFSRAQENPNHFFWNIETENFYYINREKKLFRVEFIEEGAK